MKSLFVSLLVVVGIATAGATQAADESALATAKGCMSCHDIGAKKVGPAFTEVAKKYAGQDVQAKLAKKVLEGGSGVWGPLPMPPNKTMGVTEADAKKLVAWVLGLK